MTIRGFPIYFGGGRDEFSPALRVEPGRTIADLNFEQVDNGYGRVGGYERFDGRTGPTDYPFYLLAFDTAVGAISAGDTITGATSGATGVVLVDMELDEGALDGSGNGTIGFRSLTGNFVADEEIQVGGVTKVTSIGAQETGVLDSGETQESAFGLAARTYARTLIDAVPGSGDIRGVWYYGGIVYAFRDNSGGTAVDVYKSTASGWSQITFGTRLGFTSGGTTAIAAGDTVTGATSAATGVVERISITSGSWDAGDAAGYLVLSGQSGTFQAENLDVGGDANLATIAGDSTAITLPAGGRYFFLTHNFYGSSGQSRIYGCNGVGTAFEFDGTVLAPIETGADVDTPHRIAVHRNHLVLALPNGGVQVSATGEPLSWEALLGAAVLGVGSDITDLVSNNADSLAIMARNSITVLTGSSKLNFSLATLTDEAGAQAFTAQQIGTVVYLDNRGLRGIAASEYYGNFSMEALSFDIRETLSRKAGAGIDPIASAIVRTKNQYRLFFSDGTGFSFYMNSSPPSPMEFDLGKVVKCICSAEGPDQMERIFFGSTDGYIYELDKGKSFDGEEIEAFVQLPYVHMGNPRYLKRPKKVILELVAPPFLTLNMAMEYDYSGAEQYTTAKGEATAQGGGGFWGRDDFSAFFWSAAVEGQLEADVEGQGKNMSVIIYSVSATVSSFVLQSAIIDYYVRGRAR
ncbi:MAG: hypothetical protein AAFW97_14550 [Pseudomonadota bacterium]